VSLGADPWATEGATDVRIIADSHGHQRRLVQRFNGQVRIASLVTNRRSISAGSRQGSTPVASAVNRRRERLAHWPDTVILLTVANAAIVIGAGLLLDITFPDAASYLAMNQTEAGPNHSMFYGVFNTLREWLLVPLAVLLSWHLPGRRRLLVAAVVVLYVERVITYLYFAPAVGWNSPRPAADGRWPG
jgi:hypothetical protein